MLRWSWWEHPEEKVVYWYCLDCDKRGHEPCILAMPRCNQEIIGFRLDCDTLSEEDRIAISKIQPGRLIFIPFKGRSYQWPPL